MPPAVDPNVLNAKNKCLSLDKTFTINLKQWDAILAQMQAGSKSDFFIQWMKTFHGKIHGIADLFESAAAEFQQLTGDVDMQARAEAIAGQLIVIDDTIMKFMNQVGTKKEEVEEKSDKHAAIFKPDKLDHDASIRKWRSWQQAFATFFKHMNMAKKDTQTQKALLCQCLDEKLEAMILDSHLNVLYNSETETGFFSLLHEHFDTQYPMHVRLRKLVDLKPRTGQSPSGFFQEFTTLAEDAQAQTCEVAHLLSTVMIAKCPDAILRNELLRKPRDITEALKEAKLYDANNQGPPSNATVNAVSSNGPKCGRCDRTNHKAEDCFTLKFKCPLCDKFGHSKKKCNKNNNKSNSNSSNNGNAKQESRHKANAVEDLSPKAQPTPPILF